MPVIIYYPKAQVQIIGEEAEALRVMRARRPVEVRAQKNNHVLVIRSKDVLMAEVIPNAEYKAQLEEEARAAEEAKKKNPRPGNEPRLTVPRGMHIVK